MSAQLKPCPFCGGIAFLNIVTAIEYLAEVKNDA